MLLTSSLHLINLFFCFHSGDATSSPDSGQDSQPTQAVEKRNQSLDEEEEEQKAQWDLSLLQPMSSEMAIRQVGRFDLVELSINT